MRRSPRRTPLLFPVLLLPTPTPTQHPTLQPFLQSELPSLISTYEHFHRHPELSFRERDTSKRLADLLAATGAQVTRNVGGHGVVAVLDNGPGPTVMLRADMDALPIGERTGLDYRSTIRTEDPQGRVAGIMHACGHDAHMTVLVGTARYLATHRDLWSGTLMMIGQPAEERGGGARAMLDDDLFERFPRPDHALALHVSPDLPTGTVAVREGYAMANVDSVDITMHGRGGHGAAPHTTTDPVLQAAQLVVQLQSIVSREIDPLEPAVVTVGAIHGGSKHNIIPDRCTLQLTVRSYADEVRTHLRNAITRKAEAVATAAGAPEPDVTYSEGVVSLYNEPELTRRVTAAFRETFGPDHVRTAERVITGEDFAYYGTEGVPITMFRLGSVSPERLEGYRSRGEQPPGLHSATYYPDPEGTLSTGIRAMAAAFLALTAD